MTNELEKQFFDTFGVEPEIFTGCKLEKNNWKEDTCPFEKDGIMELCHKVCKYAFTEREIYPQITDRILLELIRIIGKKPFGYLQCENTYSTNLGDIRDIITVEADSLKEGLLTLAMQNKVVLRIKHQVRTLFEEG